jgi:sodium-dependent dicarboxylate transporter 2/3/5
MRQFKLIAGPLAALLLIIFTGLEPTNRCVTYMAGVAVWMAVWWLTEVVHLAVTSLLPFVLLPLFGIADAKTVAFQYMDPIIFLFIGGFIIAFAIERWGLHQRIALKILSIVGSKPENILLGIMITTFCFSMWISNTATVMMLISAVFAVIGQVELHVDNPGYRKRIAAALLIGLAYSGSIGGMSTLVGTPTNMIFLRTYTETYPGAMEINFSSWFVFGFPVAVVLLTVTYFVLKFIFLKKEISIEIDKEYFSKQFRDLGAMKFEEKVVALIFCLTAVLWFSREGISIGSAGFKGWSELFGAKKAFIHDSTVAIVMAVLLFIIPSKNEKGRSLITWNEASRLPFDIILLFGSGFALAKGFELSGLSNWLAGELSFLDKSNLFLITLSICTVVAIISEFASNVASIQLIIPILVSIQHVLGVHPLLLMIPATLAASLGFMLPVATAPNTIVFGSKQIRVRDMMKAGAILDVVGIIVISLMMVVARKFIE